MESKERYADYYKGALKLRKIKSHFTTKSILIRLKELKNQEFVMNVPLGETNE